MSTKTKTKTKNRFALVPPNYASLKELYHELYTAYQGLKEDYIKWINDDDQKAKRSTYFRLTKEERDFLAGHSPNRDGNMTYGLRFLIQKQMLIDRMNQKREEEEGK